MARLKKMDESTITIILSSAVPVTQFFKNRGFMLALDPCQLPSIKFLIRQELSLKFEPKEGKLVTNYKKWNIDVLYLHVNNRKRLRTGQFGWSYSKYVGGIEILL